MFDSFDADDFHFGAVLKKFHDEYPEIRKSDVADALNIDRGNYIRLLNSQDMLCSTFFRVGAYLGLLIEEMQHDEHQTH